MSDLAARLESVGSTAIRLMYIHWLGKPTSFSKRDGIAALLRCYNDPDKVAEIVAGLDPTLRIAVAHLLPLGAVPLVDHLAVCVALGLDDARGVLRRLFEQGLLLPLPSTQNKLEAADLYDDRRRLLGLIPTITPFKMKPPPFRPPAVGDERALGVQIADPSVLIGVILNVMSACALRPAELRQDGALSGVSIGRLRKASGDGAGFAVFVGLASGLLRRHRGTLIPADLGAAATPMPTLLARCVDGVLASDRWLDDMPLVERTLSDVDLSGGLPGPSGPECCLARRVLAGILRRLDTAGWISADVIVNAALEPDPQVFRRAGPHDRYTRRVVSVAFVDAERTACLGVLTRTFFALGILDVASTREGARAPVERLAYASPLGPVAPSSLLVRLTALGRALLNPGSAPVRLPTAVSAEVHVGADLEVVAPRHTTSPTLRLALDTAAVSIPTASTDPVCRWRFERERWLDALVAGFDPAPFLETLAASCTRPIPPNVLTTLSTWSGQFGATTLFVGFDLVESSQPLTLAFARSVTPKWAFVPPGSVPGRVHSYADPPLACLSLHADGGIVVDAERADLRVPACLAEIAVQVAPLTYRLDRARVKAQGSASVIASLAPLALKPLPVAFAVRIRAMCQELTAVAETVEIVHVAGADALVWLPEIAPFVQGTLGASVLRVAPRCKPALLKALAALGVTVQK